MRVLAGFDCLFCSLALKIQIILIVHHFWEEEFCLPNLNCYFYIPLETSKLATSNQQLIKLVKTLKIAYFCSRLRISELLNNFFKQQTSI